MLQAQGEERSDCRKIRQLHFVQPNTPLTQALGLLLEAGVSVLPVIDEVSPAQGSLSGQVHLHGCKGFGCTNPSQERQD